MFNPTTVVIDAFVTELRKGYVSTYTNLEPDYPGIIDYVVPTRTSPRRLPADSVGDAAIFTVHMKMSHVIRKVLLQQIGILNYVNPF